MANSTATAQAARVKDGRAAIVAANGVDVNSMYARDRWRRVSANQVHGIGKLSLYFFHDVGDIVVGKLGQPPGGGIHRRHARIAGAAVLHGFGDHVGDVDQRGVARETAGAPRHVMAFHHFLQLLGQFPFAQDFAADGGVVEPQYVLFGAIEWNIVVLAAQQRFAREFRDFAVVLQAADIVEQTGHEKAFHQPFAALRGEVAGGKAAAHAVAPEIVHGDEVIRQTLEDE